MTDRVTQIRSIIAAYPTGNGQKCTIPPEHIDSLDLLSPMAFKILKDHLYRWPITRSPGIYLSLTWRLMGRMLDKNSKYLDALASVLQRMGAITNAEDFTAAMNAVDEKIKKDRKRESLLADSDRSHGHIRSAVIYQPIITARGRGTMSASYIV